MTLGSATMSERDEFGERRRRILGERASYLCSNPDCRKATIGPHSDPEKSLSDGVAAHINAAAVGGPRYDDTQTPAMRSGLANGVWLCHSCSDLIDKDPVRFPADRLRQWKADHERWLSGEGVIPPLPTISLRSLSGLSLPSSPGTISSEMVAALRERVLEVAPVGKKAISAVSLRIQLPEFVVGADIDCPAGTAFKLQPERMQMMVSAQGGGSVTVHGGSGPPPSANLKIEIDRLLPRQVGRFRLITVADRQTSEWSRARNAEIFAGSAQYYIEGYFQYERRGEFCARHFFVELKYDHEIRSVESGTVEEDLMQPRVQTMSF
jgi:hypothetical protein